MFSLHDRRLRNEGGNYLSRDTHGSMPVHFLGHLDQIYVFNQRASPSLIFIIIQQANLLRRASP